MIKDFSDHPDPELAFSGSDLKYMDYNNAPNVLLPIPWGKSISTDSDPQNGPASIINSSKELELFNIDTLKSPFFDTGGVHTYKKLSSLDNLNSNQMVDTTMKESAKILNDSKFLISLGGDHSISEGPVLAAKEFVGKSDKLTLIQFDAHMDLYDSFEGNKRSHACVIRRIIETDANQEIDIYQIGIRNVSEDELEYAKEKNITYKSALELVRFKNKYDWYEEFFYEIKNRNVYITIDVDFFDPSEMPGTGTPVAVGPKLDHTLVLLEKIFKNNKVIACDIVEVSPKLDLPSNITSQNAGMLVYRLIEYKHFLNA